VLDACQYGGLTAANLPVPGFDIDQSAYGQPAVITAKHPMSSQRLAEGLTITKPGHRDAVVAGVIVVAVLRSYK
jgi:hypothetical protein